ncbi:hypothetical protein [Daejeonella oryzae]|uniref:hypothetical protein n=1 Tax=Daejeonella oryzae TaxID=1122943 RepID=UPI0003FF9CF1|nr:hypothetical protein [Daejeonella oryzae]
MENIKETYNRSESVVQSNSPSHYKLIAIGIVVGLIGIMLRFVTDWVFIDIVSNIIFVIGIFLCIKAVLNILK